MRENRKKNRLLVEKSVLSVSITSIENKQSNKNYEACQWLFSLKIIYKFEFYSVGLGQEEKHEHD